MGPKGQKKKNGTKYLIKFDLDGHNLGTVLETFRAHFRHIFESIFSKPCELEKISEHWFRTIFSNCLFNALSTDG